MRRLILGFAGRTYHIVANLVSRLSYYGVRHSSGFAMFVKLPSIALRMVKTHWGFGHCKCKLGRGITVLKMTNSEATDTSAQGGAIASGYIDLFVTCFCLELISFRYNQRLSHGFIAIS